MDNVYDIFEARGFEEQVTDAGLVKTLLEKPTTCYIGFDTTGSSLH
ncbi:MAG: tyrosine--tRNA ligase, partial [Deltaproteobacteria bacterium]|nr:tyrosine--tRNA ligase [Deltaproteobacteria bacterium]